MNNSTHWWMALPAIPTELDDAAYRRLRKIWADKTRFRGKGMARKHEFVTPEWEMHLIATLWENFRLFEPHLWLSKLARAAGVSTQHGRDTSCNWSYGFRERSTRKIADIVIGFRDSDSAKGCYVIEAKRPHGRLTSKDLDPMYYLSIESIAEIPDARLIYCVDEPSKQRLVSLFSQMPDTFSRCGAVSWEEIGGIQVELAQSLPVSPDVSAFIAGAIQYQFHQHGITPSVRARPYLEHEASIEDVDGGLRTPYDNHDPQWADCERGDPRTTGMREAPGFQHCPACGDDVPSNSRYPRYLCRTCAASVTSSDGRLLRFSNTNACGGFVAHFADTGEEHRSHLCMVNGLVCWADEARFGGTVIEACAPDSRRPVS
jgi:hypothetical protein